MLVNREEPQHSHDGGADDWDASKHGGMSREELRAYADKLDLDVRQLPVDKVFDTIQNGTHIFFFGAVFCAHTQQFTAIWLNAQFFLDFYYPNTPNFSIAKIQCGDNQTLCFNLMRDEGYPTVVLFHNGVYVQEAPDRNEIWPFMEKTVKSVAAGNFSDMVGKGSVVVKPVIETKMISHEKLEQEAVGGKAGMMESMLPVSLICTLVLVVLVATFIARRKSGANAAGAAGPNARKGRYSALG
ncbi:hypothetical protein HDU78_002016 [Chytriomyces hyalinus]|nr:hypothetical protein HDU78_002016 [Chytriomyces hyalinus]